MRLWVTIALLILTLGYAARSKQVQGKVTYIASGTVYTSLGSEQGVKDSTLIYVLQGSDTLAVLKVIAVSSKSSSSFIVKMNKAITVGDLVVAPHTEITQKVTSDTTVHRESTMMTMKDSSLEQYIGHIQPREESPFVKFHGRLGIQYFATLYYDVNNNITQPSMIIDLRGSVSNIPLKLELYGNIRSLSYGSSSPFSSNSNNQSRIYRLSLRYDDGENALAAGRFVPVVAPTIGYIDGLMLSKKFGQVILGTAFGYQSRPSLNGITTTYKKLALFGNYQTTGPMSMSASLAYSRNYFHSNLDREVISGMLNVISTEGLGIFTNGEVDLRRKNDTQFELSPSLTNLYAAINYSVTRFLALSFGGDVSRAYSDYSLIQSFPDSLIDRQERRGLNMGINLYATGGVSFTNTYAPRSSSTGFGKEYSNTSSLMLSNMFSTGVMLRAYFNLNANELTTSNGFGFNADKMLFDGVQCSFHYQRSRYTIKSLDEKNTSNSFGGTMVWALSREMSLVIDYNRLDGFGTVAKNIFAELGYRF